MNCDVSKKLGSNTPIFSLRLKGWLFSQAWIMRVALRMLARKNEFGFIFSGLEPPIFWGRGNASAAI